MAVFEDDHVDEDGVLEVADVAQTTGECVEFSRTVLSVNRLFKVGI